MAKKICFLVGHGISSNGSYDPGAVSGKYEEFKIAKEIGKYAQEYYNKTYSEQADLMNYNGNLCLQDRINKCQDNTYDFIAEIHLNAGGGNGVECYYSHRDVKGRKYADAICDNISAALGIPQRPNWSDEDGGDKVKLDEDGRDYFGIIRRTTPTAVLIETVFIDTPSNLNAVKTASGQKKCGEAIAKAVASVRGVKKKTKTESPKSSDKSLSGKYKTTSDLNLRSGAGTSKSIMTVIPKGTIVENYGYYTATKTVKWLYVQFTHKGVTYTGFASANHLTRADANVKSTTKKYFKKYTGSSVSIVDSLKAIGVNSSFAYREKIAKANGIKSYTSTAAQNIKLLNLLKQGKLIVP